ncbi:MAG: glycosyltransferase [Bacteroidaceae bacterium]|nr:glycosyltransferase [Bacteroidaceae bacterium]
MFSIVTVTYNAAATIERTLQSVAMQTFQNYEHLIIDGASTDNTLEICRRYQTERMTIVSEPDKGLYDAMNKGLQRATGEYICFLNAGDKLHSADTLKHLAEAAKGQEAGILYGYTDIVDAAGKFLYPRRLVPPERLTWKSFRWGMLVCHQAFYVNRQIARQYDLNYRFSADFDWCIRCIKEGERRGLGNVFVREPLCDYLSEGMTTLNHRASLKERFRIMVKHYGWFSTVMMHGWFFVRNFQNKC